MTIRIITEKPVAIDSPDHIEPLGTANDNSSSTRFNRKLAAWLPSSRWRVLDIGCSGGGFVKSILDAGGLAVGVEGSDYSKRIQRAEWATIPDHLFTADATAPFEIITGENGIYKTLRFNLITGWEFLEHIRTEDLLGFAQNIEKHLEVNGLAFFSVAPISCIVNGIELHQTIQGREWWIDKFAQMGFVHHEAVIRYFRKDVVRPDTLHYSFHLALTREKEHLPNPSRLYWLLFPRRIKKMLTPPSLLRRQVIKFIEDLDD